MSDRLKHATAARTTLDQFFSDESGSVDILALADDTKSFFSWMWRYKIPVAGALLALLHVTVKQVDEHKTSHTTHTELKSNGRVKTITSLIEELERQNPAQFESSVDEISQLLARLQLPTVRDFMSRHYEKSDETKTLNEQPWVLECLAHNALREARSTKDIRERGHQMVAFVTIARSMLRGAGFPYGDICAVVKQPGQFSWTFDKRLLDMPIREEMRKQYSVIHADLKQKIGHLTPKDAWHLLSKELALDSKAVYYHHEKMWSDAPGLVDSKGQPLFPRPPRPADFEKMNKQQKAIILRNERYYKMSPKVANFFAGLLRRGGEPISVGTHKVYRYTKDR